MDHQRRLESYLRQFSSQSSLLEKERVLREVELSHSYTEPDIANLDEAQLTSARECYASMLYKKELKSAQDALLTPRPHSFYKKKEYEWRSRIELLLPAWYGFRSPYHFVFVGCGAYPLSAILTAAAGHRITLLDHSVEAIEIASDLLKYVNVSAELHCIEADEWRPKEMEPMFAILSGTVGTTSSEKDDISRKILKNIGPGSTLCVRQPMREEKLLMAPISEQKLGIDACVTFETSFDYTRRVLLTKDANSGRMTYIDRR